MAKRKSKMPVSKAKTAYELLGEIRKIILEEPKRYDQTDTLFHCDASDPLAPACGTIGCVAGWVVALKAPKTHRMHVLEAAARILGIHKYDSWMLFDSDQARGKPQTYSHARSGAAHIARFMKKHEAQLKAKSV